MASAKKTVLVIEDESEMIDLVRLVLERKGLKVVGALTGREGLETVQRIKPDLVLVDPKLPDMDGWEVYRRIKADDELKNTRVVVITSKAGSIDWILKGDR
jgi:CheY-like chemotaxis protein